MKKIYLVHGWDGGSGKDWFPYVQKDLMVAGYDVTALDFPHPETPTISEWVGFLKDNIPNPDIETYIVAHSIGCQTALRYLENIDTKIGGAIFVAGWFHLTNEEDTDEAKDIATPWLATPIDFEKVKQNLPWSVAILSTDDPAVPYQITKEFFEKNLNPEIITIENAGHFTTDDGFGPFPQLIEIIKNKIK